MHRNIFSFVLVLLPFFLCTCTADMPSTSSGQKPASGGTAAASSGAAASDPCSLTLSPREPNRRSSLQLRPDGFELNRSNIRWILDGSPVASESATEFNCSQARKGSTVQAIAVIPGREVRSNEVTIVNTPPELTDVSLQPAMFGQDQTLSVSAKASDIDGDIVTIQCAWTVNGMPAGNGPTLARSLHRGDVVHVEIVAHDGTAFSRRITLDRTIDNRPPVFVEHQNVSYRGNTLVYQAQATDPDGDRISYAIESAPEGMTIDQGTGRITWTVPGGFHGEQPVTIVADDGHGGTARYTVTFTIKE